MEKLQISKAIAQKFTVLHSFANTFIVCDDKLFSSSYCDFLIRLRRSSGCSIELFIFRPNRGEVCFYGTRAHAKAFERFWGGYVNPDWLHEGMDIYSWSAYKYDICIEDIEKAWLYT